MVQQLIRVAASVRHNKEPFYIASKFCIYLQDIEIHFVFPLKVIITINIIFVTKRYVRAIFNTGSHIS